MGLLYQTIVLMVLVASVNTELEGREGTEAASINPPVGSPAHINSKTCNCSAIRRKIFWLQDDTKHQLDQISNAFSEMAEELENLLDPPTALSAPTPTPPVASNLNPKDCSDVLSSSTGANNSGVYTIYPLDNVGPIDVFCDMETDGGGWTVFQRRQDGSVNFDLEFDRYREGFGDLEGEFWLGNDNLHRFTYQDLYVLRVDITDFDGNSAYAVYDKFRIDDERNKYRMRELGRYTGTAGDAMSFHDYVFCTTKDRDNDNHKENCDDKYGGGWWFKHCYKANLNGNYTTDGNGVEWNTWKGFRDNTPLQTSEMKLRKKK